MSALPHYDLRFEQGTLLLQSTTATSPPPGDGWAWDERVEAWRAHADAYRELFAALHRAAQRQELSYTDHARRYAEVPLRLKGSRTPRSYQKEALAAWQQAGGRGQIILPTGAGKSFVAFMIMQQVQRHTLIVVPTLDLMHQWYTELRASFALDEVGLIGGGYNERLPVTVTTYDSAWIHAPRHGEYFGLLVFDECHHLPGPTYQQAARMMIAPWRLGLTATPEREDGQEVVNDERIGPIVYRKGIRDLAGDFLADYDVEEIRVALTEEERAAYDEARGTYLGFVRDNGIRFSEAGGWARFLQLAARSAWGRSAMRAYRQQRSLALSSEEKLRVVEELLEKHIRDRIIIFTNDNETVYELARRLLIPPITHQTATKERAMILQNFREGRWPVVVTSRVLNEGVDVPEARVAIVLSGTGTIREHVQRLGRILRREGDKRAILYELITDATVEESVSERRREHDAYR